MLMAEATAGGGADLEKSNKNTGSNTKIKKTVIN
jgi:hypothetical protein